MSEERRAVATNEERTRVTAFHHVPVLAEQIDLRSDGPDYVALDTLPKGQRSFGYQETVNAGGNPSEEVIDENRAAQGREYRLQTEGDHPVADLRQPAGSGAR